MPQKKNGIFLGTGNEGKIERYKRLLPKTGISLEIYTPSDYGLQGIDTEENGATLAENAELKAKAYFGKVPMPILTNDTGFWVEGEGLIQAPKRTALGELSEEYLSDEARAHALLTFWQNIARKHGGKVDAAWVEAFVLLHPDGTMRAAESRREVILTDRIFGEPHAHIPVRALYIAKTTGKPAAQHTDAEEIIEFQAVIEALSKLLREYTKQ